MEEVQKVVQKGHLERGKTENVVVGVGAIKALNDVLSIKSQGGPKDLRTGSTLLQQQQTICGV